MTNTFTLSEDAQRWLVNGERGISSEAIFSHLSGLNISDSVWWQGFGDTPSDPADLRRCMLLLKAVPEFANDFEKMKSRSKKWAKLVDAWDNLTSCFIKEAGNKWWSPKTSWSAPKTFEMMQALNL